MHNQWYYGLDLFFSIVLLLLALVEEPAVDRFELPPIIHSTLELVCLGNIYFHFLISINEVCLVKSHLVLNNPLNLEVNIKKLTNYTVKLAAYTLPIKFYFYLHY